MNIKTKHRSCPLCNNEFGKKIITLKQIDIIKCSQCRFVFADITIGATLQKNKLSPEVFYNSFGSESYISSAYYDRLLKKIKTRSKTKDKLKILDFGCGTGLLLIRAEKQGIQAYGSDFSSYAKEAKKQFGLKIEIGDILKTKYPTNYFDAIITHATHEHLYNLIEITKKLKELLKTYGILVLSGIPNFNILSRRFFNNYYLNSPPGHINYFEKHSIKKLLKIAGLKQYSIKTYGFDIWYIKRKLNNMIGSGYKSKKKKAKNEQVKKEIKRFDNEIGIKHRIASKLYEAYGILLPGKSFEVFAIKPED